MYASKYRAACLLAIVVTAQLKYIHYLVICLLSSCGYRLRAMVAEKIFDSPEARYNYARFPRASKNFSSGMWLPIKSASMPKCDPMHRICQSTHQLRAHASTRSGHQQPDNRTRLKWHRFDPLRLRLCVVLRTCRHHCNALQQPWVL